MNAFSKLFVAAAAAATLWFTGQNAQAQCTPTGCTLNPNVFLGIACFTPNPLPDGTVTVFYDQTIQITTVDTLPDNPTLAGIGLNNQPVHKIKLEGIDNLPPGITYQSKSANAADLTIDEFTPVNSNSGIVACIRLFGTPTSTIAPDTFKLKIKISLTAGTLTLPSSLISQVGGDNLSIPLYVSPDAPTCGFTATTTAPTCPNGTDGVINCTPTSGQAPYQYALDNGPYQSTAQFTGVAEGSHVVKMKDGAGCETNQSVILTASSTLALELFPQNISCTQAKGVIVAEATGGATPYSYALNGGATQSSKTFSDLNAGDYTVTVTDALGCQKEVTVSISNVAATVTLNAAAGGPGCPSGGQSVLLTATGGQAPYSYSLNGGAGQTSDVFACLQNGSYNFAVQDANGCEAQTTFVVNISSVNDLLAGANYSLYPNPATNNLTFAGTGLPNGLFAAQIIDLSGKTVLKTNIAVNNATAQTAIDLNHLPAGAYLMRVAEWNLNLKFLKN